jgi:hypothetical protein
MDASCWSFGDVPSPVSLVVGAVSVYCNNVAMATTAIIAVQAPNEKTRPRRAARKEEHKAHVPRGSETSAAD